jgi:hypothetical protein
MLSDNDGAERIGPHQRMILCVDGLGSGREYTTKWRQGQKASLGTMAAPLIEPSILGSRKRASSLFPATGQRACLLLQIKEQVEQLLQQRLALFDLPWRSRIQDLRD